jgi:hypothetical protein
MRRVAKGGGFGPRPAPTGQVRFVRIVRLNGEVLERYIGADSAESAIARGWELFPQAQAVETVRAKKVPVGNPTRGRIWESIDPRGNVQGRG